MLSLRIPFNLVPACGKERLFRRRTTLAAAMRLKKVDVGPAAGCSAGCRPAASDTESIRLLCQLIFRRCVRPRRRVIHAADVSQTPASRFPTTKTANNPSDKICDGRLCCKKTQCVCIFCARRNRLECSFSVTVTVCEGEE